MATKKQDEFEEVRSGYVKFNVVDDYVKGVLIDIFTPTSPDRFGKKNKTYILRAIEGTFHGNDENKVIDKDATVLEEGQVVRVGSNDRVDSSMAGIKLGQKVLFRLKELRPTTKGNPAKIIGVFKGPMDDQWLKEKEQEAKVDEEFNQA